MYALRGAVPGLRRLAQHAERVSRRTGASDAIAGSCPANGSQEERERLWCGREERTAGLAPRPPVVFFFFLPRSAYPAPPPQRNAQPSDAP